MEMLCLGIVLWSRSVVRSVNFLRAPAASVLSWLVAEAFASLSYSKVLFTAFDGCMSAAPHRWKQETVT